MNVTFNWIGGATFILTFGDIKIAIDPVLCPKDTVQDYFWFKSKRIEEPIYQKEDFSNIDMWLITHNHEDHLDDLGLAQISNPSTVICNKNTFNKLKQKGIDDLTLLNWHHTKSILIKDYEITVKAIPAIHGINPVSALFAGKVNGYLLTIKHQSQEATIYITSDTVYKKWIINKLKDTSIDLLIPNMGAAKQGSWIMTLTLNAKMLQKMIRQLNPKTIIPVHYGTFEHYKEPVEKIEKLNDQRIKIVKVGSNVMLDLGES